MPADHVIEDVAAFRAAVAQGAAYAGAGKLKTSLITPSWEEIPPGY